MKSLAALIDELETYLPVAGHKKESVSQVSIGWHIEHSLLAMIKMISAVEHADPSKYRWKFNMKRLIVLTMGKIPRGRARVPDSVKPAEEMNLENIKALLEKARKKIEVFEQLAPDKYFTHPVFGDVRRNKARRVIAIHTEHHLKIIKDISGK